MFKSIKDFLLNYRGIKIDRKILLFLVDDYGTIRVASSESLDELQKLNPKVAQNRFNKFDDIAMSQDLTALFETLNSVGDKNGNPAVFTPMTVVANPNFQAIREVEFTEYHYESFFETLQKKPDGENTIELWREGISKGIFVPEFHGREHLNVRFWLNYLKKGDQMVKKAFDFNSIGVEPNNNEGKGYMAAFDFYEHNHLEELNQIVGDGLNLFEKLFGYRSIFFTPSALIHNDAMHQNLKDNGINYIDMARSREEPRLNGTSRKRFHYMGQKNNYGQTYITRNVMFEPNKDERDWVKSALNEIEVAFKYNKPAIVSSHRVNFVGGKSEQNREKGLNDLKNLLNQVVQRWPDIEFMSLRTFTQNINLK